MNSLHDEMFRRESEWWQKGLHNFDSSNYRKEKNGDSKVISIGELL
jgi:hypothetical protein